MVTVYSGNETEKAAKLLQMLEDMGVDVRLVGDASLEQTMADILANPQPESEGSGSLFLYYGDESRESIDAIEKAIKEGGLSIPCKAVGTENNRAWTLAYLIDEVGREAAWFASREKLYDLLKKADPKRMETDAEYAKLMSMAWALLHEEEVSQDILDMAVSLVEDNL